MLYSLTLITKKEDTEALTEIKKYIEEKKGKIVSSQEKNNLRFNHARTAQSAGAIKIDFEISSDEVEKVKKKINHEKEIISYLLEKVRILKFKKGKAKPKKKVAPAKKEKVSQTQKVVASMQEEEKKIKDLDSTLDKILNE